MKGFWGSLKHKKGSSDETDNQLTWYGVNKTLFLRLGLAAILFIAGVFLPDNTLTVFLILLSVLISGYDVMIRAAVRLAKERVLGEELLITVATILCFTINAEYEAAAVMLIYQAGYALRMYAGELTRSNLRERIDPYVASIPVIQGEETVNMSPEQIQRGDLLVIDGGSRFPVDCRAADGPAQIELRNILGKSKQRVVEKGRFIPAGAVNLGEKIHVRADGSLVDSAFFREINFITDKSLLHSTAEEDVERYAGIYAPFALGLSILAALLLLIFSKVSTENAIHRALMILIVASPTAFLAPIPLAYLSGLFRSMDHGVLVKGSQELDAITHAGAVILDSNDMLTTGQYRVLSVKSDRMDSNVLLKVAAHAGSEAQSPLIRSITDAYEGVIDHSLIRSFSEQEGGIFADIDGVIITMGLREFMDQSGITVADESNGQLTVYLSLNGLYAGCILLSDVVREDSQSSMMAVESTGCDCILLSGESRERTQNIAAAAGIREYHAECMPLDRLEKIQEIKERFPSNSVLYVGRGTGDSSCLSAADVGVCVNGLESETAFQAGDVVIMDDEAAPLADAIDSGNLVQRTVRQTLIAVFAAKLLLLLLSLFGVSYQLWFAMMVDVIAGVAGILASARIWEEHRY